MIRLARIEDLQRITEIYNQSIRHGFETAHTEELDFSEREEWFRSHTPERYPLYVFEREHSIAGWITVSPYRSGRQALRFTVELSYYVDENFRKQGIGRSLLEFAMKRCEEMGYRTLLAIVIDRNIASISLLKSLNFSEWGHLPDVADFRGDRCGHLYYGLSTAN
jgi:L-amino acid N-acyltransferase YncA